MEHHMNGNNDGAPQTCKWVIIHGHFYQPPRENPWLNIIETQGGALPYHDWNERIYAECYRPNGSSRLLDPDGMISHIHNNYTTMSFNFGPTLMSWIEKNHPKTARRISHGDKEGARLNAGHGNALAQVYNHIIMPLASCRDKLTQIRWAKAAFRRSFDRDPEGMWLAETAVNMETIRCLIDENISFIVCSPNQAESVRRLHDSSHWIPTSEHPLDTKQPYRLFLRDNSGNGDGRYIDIFFFNEPLSKEISFNDLLKDAHTLGKRIDGCFTPGSDHDEVTVIATDGETFGHHKPFGDMCLAYFFSRIAPQLSIQPTNFGHYLSLHPPQYEVTLRNAFGEGTSWSCAHGVGRWIRDCGCSTGGKTGWHQKWRGPLRNALDRLQKRIDTVYETACSDVNMDPWALRDEYGCCFEGPALPVGSGTSSLQTPPPLKGLTPDKERRLRRLLEAQKFMLFSFTSCGWFFSDISGIETMQNLSYACRAIQLGLSPGEQAEALRTFMSDLTAAESNIPGKTGAKLFERDIMPFFYHESMICFTAAMLQSLGINRIDNAPCHGYNCSVRELKAQKSALSQLFPSNSPLHIRTYEVSLNNTTTAESGVWLVTTDLSDFAQPAGWVLPTSEVSGPAGTTYNPASIRNNPKARRFTLADIFVTLRHELSTIYLKKIAVHSDKKFMAWFEENERNLALLLSFYPEMPEYFHAPIIFLLQNRWDAVFRKLENPSMEKECVAELSDIWQKAQRFRVEPDLGACTTQCEKILTVELENLVRDLNANQCERISTLLDIVDLYKIPVLKSKFEDMAYPVLTGPLTELYNEVINAEKTTDSQRTGNRKKLLLKLLNFARRMNFSTKQFPV